MERPRIVGPGDRHLAILGLPPGYAAYGAMKGAVEVLTRYLAKELGARGIAVNTIAVTLAMRC